jgi:hypothetical protein
VPKKGLDNPPNAPVAGSYWLANDFTKNASLIEIMKVQTGYLRMGYTSIIVFYYDLVKQYISQPTNLPYIIKVPFVLPYDTFIGSYTQITSEVMEKELGLCILHKLEV